VLLRMLPVRRKPPIKTIRQDEASR
jgi:hypothetical protein